MTDSNITSGSTLTNIINSEVIDATIAAALREPSVMRGLVSYRNIAGKGSKICTFTGWPADAAGDLTETTDMTATVVGSLDNTQVTCAVVGIMRELSDLALATTILSPQELTATLVQDGVAACADMAEDDLANLIDAGTAGTAGSSGVDYAIADFITQLGYLRAAKVPGPYVWVADDVAYGDFQRAIVASTGAVFGTGLGNSVLTSQSGGYGGSFLGVECYYSNYPDTQNGGTADVTTGMWADPRVASNDQHCAFALVELWSPRVRQVEMVEGPGIAFSVSYAYGVGTKQADLCAISASDG